MCSDSLSIAIENIGFCSDESIMAVGHQPTLYITLSYSLNPDIHHKDDRRLTADDEIYDIVRS